jgi:ACR3 family arsenite efflux pump ArsB
LLGIFAGKTIPCLQARAGAFIEIFLLLMLFFVFLGIEIKAIGASFRNLGFALSSLTINFIWTPLFAFGLAQVFFPGAVGLQIGFLMLMLTPCTDWYLIFTGLAAGNVALGASILPLNLILQIILLPFYLFVFAGQSVSFEPEIIVRTIALVLLLPLFCAHLLKTLLGADWRPLAKLLDRNDDIQFGLLCLAVAAMFASQGSVLLANLGVFGQLLLPLLIFFAVNFVLAWQTGKKLGLVLADIIPLIFTTAARNSPIALAIAVLIFPEQAVIALILVIGPLIELPVLALNAAILKKLARPK